MDFEKLLTYQKLTKLFNLMDKDSDNFISIKDLHNFTYKSMPLDHCHSIMKECLYLLEFCTDKEPQVPYGCEQFDIPSDQMRLSFSQFKNIVLN